MLESSYLDRGLAARRRLFFLRPDLPASRRCTEGQTWPSVRSGRWTGAGSEKYTRCMTSCIWIYGYLLTAICVSLLKWKIKMTD